MSVLWTLEDMAAAMRAEKCGVLPADVPGISIDSRSIAKGEAFFAILGDNRDGHEFVDAALKGGAGVAVIARVRRNQFPADAPLLLVDDVLEALRDLARAARTRLHAKVIAVTGSVGKTGTKEALRLALGADGETHASAASYNNHWGVPLSLARCSASAKYAVFEIGMNHAGEITPLTKLVRRMSRSLPALNRYIWNISAASKKSPTPRPKSFQVLSRTAAPFSTAIMRNMLGSRTQPKPRAFPVSFRSANTPKPMSV